MRRNRIIAGAAAIMVMACSAMPSFTFAAGEKVAISANKDMQFLIAISLFGMSANRASLACIMWSESFNFASILPSFVF